MKPRLPIFLLFLAGLAAAQDKAELAGAPGDLVPADYQILRRLPPVALVLTPSRRAQFLLSNGPERFVAGDGIAMQERVSPGLVRLYLYHVPEPGGARKTISALIENLGSGPLNVRFSRRVFPPPGHGYYSIAQQALMAFLGPSEDGTSLRVPSGQRAALDGGLDGSVVSEGELVHAIYEFQIDQPARVTTFERSPEKNSAESVDALPKLPRRLPGGSSNGSGRGLFSTSDIDVTNGSSVVDTASGPRRLTVADGKDDPWIEGQDSMSQAASRDVGNYGVVYRIRIQWRSGDGRSLALLAFNPLATEPSCRFQGGVVALEDQLVPLPAHGSHFDGLKEAVLIGKFPPPSAGRTETLEFSYSPPGASCLPMSFALLPYKN